MNAAHERPTLVIVEDHQQLREELLSFLLDEGFDAYGAESGSALNEILLTRRVDMVILDLNMPEEDGVSIAKRLRSSMPQIGIVMLTARVNGADRTLGYQGGADVYLTKPTRSAELSAVIHNLWARLSQSRAEPCWLLDVKKLILTFGESRSIALTYVEVQVLQILAVNAGHVAREVLMAAIVADKDIALTAKARLELLISRLRAKLAPYTADNNVIKSVRGIGYQLCLPLQIKPLAAEPRTLN